MIYNSPTGRNMRGPTTKRSSIFGSSTVNETRKQITTPLEAISHRIEEIIKLGVGIIPCDVDPKLHLNTDVEIIEVQVGENIYKVRSVFLPAHQYKVGWIVDCDLQECMMCTLPFSWTRARVHCRACGSLLCQKCSPFSTTVPCFEEKKGSRVCTNCFGLRVDVRVAPIHRSNLVLNSPNNKDSRNQRFKTSRISLGGLRPNLDENDASAEKRPAFSSQAVEEMEKKERDQAMMCEYAFRVMKGLVSPDIHRCTLEQLKENGLPEQVAQRVLRLKALWMLSMHQDDIAKIHIADLRSKYQPHGLDLVETRALWHWLQERDWFDGPRDKLEWMYDLKNKLQEMCKKEELGQLEDAERRHPAYKGSEHLLLYDIHYPIQRRYDHIASTDKYAPNSPMRDSTTPITRSPTVPNPSKPPKPAKNYRSDALGLGLDGNRNQGSRTPLSPKPTKPRRDSGANSPAPDTPNMNVTKKTASSPHPSSEAHAFADKSPFPPTGQHPAPQLNSATYLSPLVNPTANKKVSPDSMSDVGELGSDQSPFTLLMQKRAEVAAKVESSKGLMMMTSSVNSDQSLVMTPQPKEAEEEIFAIQEDIIPAVAVTHTAPTDVMMTPCDVIPVRGAVPVTAATPHVPRPTLADEFDDDYMMTRYVAPQSSKNLMTSATKTQMTPHSVRKPLFGTSTPPKEEDEQDENNVPVNKVDNKLQPISATKSLFKDAKKRLSSIGVPGTRRKQSPEQQKAALIKLIEIFEPEQAKELLQQPACPRLDQREASAMLMKSVDKIASDDTIPLAAETLILLIDEFKADVNVSDASGKTPLAVLFTDPIIGRALMSRGADVLAEDHTGSCALSISFEYGIEWMYDCWLSLDGEGKLKANDDRLKVNKYVACLILGGYGTKAMELIKNDYASITPDEASQLWSICHGNLEYMKEPIETFDLLQYLNPSIEISG